MSTWPDHCDLCAVRKLKMRRPVAVLGWLRPTATTGAVPVGLCAKHDVEVLRGDSPNTTHCIAATT